MRPVCFLSDFGLVDDFVGTCKGVMLGVAPGLVIVDLTHDVPGFAVEVGAEILEHAARYMPADAVYLAVVDPGVGTERRALALRTERDALLVGPDNGLLLPAADALGSVAEAVILDNPDYHVHPVSNTFHGRDVFSPATAHLASGTALARLGRSLSPNSLVRLEETEEPGAPSETLEAGVISIDRFGNARLSIFFEDLGLEYGDWLKIDAGDGQMSVRYVETFGSSKAGELVIVPDSHWRLSLCVNRGNASQALALKRGGRVRLTRTGNRDAAGA
jgi:S-adenosylmethionine hydrolase